MRTVLELVGGVDRQGVELLLATGRTHDTQVRSLGQTQPTHQRPLCAVTLFAEDADDRKTVTKRTANRAAGFGLRQLGCRLRNRRLLDERLQHGFHDKPQRAIGLLDIAAVVCEVGVHEMQPLVPLEPAQSGGRFCQARGSNARQPGEKIRYRGENRTEIERFDQRT